MGYLSVRMANLNLYTKFQLKQISFSKIVEKDLFELTLGTYAPKRSCMDNYQKFMDDHETWYMSSLRLK